MRQLQRVSFLFFLNFLYTVGPTMYRTGKRYACTSILLQRVCIQDCIRTVLALDGSDVFYFADDIKFARPYCAITY